MARWSSAWRSKAGYWSACRRAELGVARKRRSTSRGQRTTKKARDACEELEHFRDCAVLQDLGAFARRSFRPKWAISVAHSSGLHRIVCGRDRDSFRLQHWVAAGAGGWRAGVAAAPALARGAARAAGCRRRAGGSCAGRQAAGVGACCFGGRGGGGEPAGGRAGCAAGPRLGSHFNDDADRSATGARPLRGGAMLLFPHRSAVGGAPGVSCVAAAGAGAGGE